MSPKYVKKLKKVVCGGFLDLRNTVALECYVLGYYRIMHMAKQQRKTIGLFYFIDIFAVFQYMYMIAITSWPAIDA